MADLIGSFEWSSIGNGGPRRPDTIHQLRVYRARGGLEVWYKRPLCAASPGCLPTVLPDDASRWLAKRIEDAYKPQQKPPERSGAKAKRKEVSAHG